MGTEISHIDIHRKQLGNEISFNLAAHGSGGGHSISENSPKSTALVIARLLKECKRINPDETIELTSTRDLHTMIRVKGEQLNKEELTQILSELQNNREILGMKVRFQIGEVLWKK